MNGAVVSQMQFSITHLSGSVDSLKLEQSEKKLWGVNFMCLTSVGFKVGSTLSIV